MNALSATSEQFFSFNLLTWTMLIDFFHNDLFAFLE